LLSSDADKSRAIIRHWCSSDGQAEVELIECAQQQKPFVKSLLDGKAESALAAPALNMFLACDSENLNILMLSAELVPIRSASSFIALDASGGPLANFTL